MIELKNIQVEFSRDGASATAAVDDVSLTIPVSYTHLTLPTNSRV